MVATLLEYLRGMADSGLDADSAAALISLRFAVGSRIFPEIAKLRAARCLWRAALGAVGVEGPAAVRLHGVGSRRSLAQREPELNLLRASEQAFVALCGTVDAVSSWGFDHALGTSGPLARRLARNTLLILGHEGRLRRVEDPAAGSFFVEAVTRELAEQGWVVAQEIERGGGMRQALLSGRIREMIASTAARRAKAFEAGEAAMTGVTEYVGGSEFSGEDGSAPGQRSPVPGTTVEELRARLEAHRASWEAPGLGDVEYSRDFVVEEVVSRACKGETLHELSRRLGGPEGSEEIEPFALRRDAEPFESVEAVREEDAEA